MPALSIDDTVFAPELKAEAVHGVAYGMGVSMFLWAVIGAVAYAVI